MDRKRVLLLVAGLLVGTILSVLVYKVLDIPFLKQIIPIVFLGVLLTAEIVKMKRGMGKKGFVAIYTGILLLAIGIFIAAHF